MAGDSRVRTDSMREAQPMPARAGEAVIDSARDAVVGPVETLLLARIACEGGATRSDLARDSGALLQHKLSPAEVRAAVDAGVASPHPAGICHRDPRPAFGNRGRRGGWQAALSKPDHFRWRTGIRSVTWRSSPRRLASAANRRRARSRSRARKDCALQSCRPPMVSKERKTFPTPSCARNWRWSRWSAPSATRSRQALPRAPVCRRKLPARSLDSSPPRRANLQQTQSSLRNWLPMPSARLKPIPTLCA